MQGFNTLWLPGTDHAAIATEVKVIKALKEQGIDKDDLVTEASQRFARLGSGIVEFACLTDDDRARSDNEDSMDVCSFHNESSFLSFRASMPDLLLYILIYYLTFLRSMAVSTSLVQGN